MSKIVINTHKLIENSKNFKFRFKFEKNTT